MGIITTLTEKINNSLKSKDKQTKDKLYKTLDIDLIEKVKYFELNSQSFATGIINLEISQFVYNKLKNYESTTLTERIIITKLMEELLQKKLFRK